VETVVFKKLLAGLGFGGVEVDTVLSAAPATPGGPLTGHVNLRAKGETDISDIWLLLVANGPMGQAELGRFQVASSLHLPSGTSQAVPFTISVPPNAPFTVLYGYGLPGASVGVRTEVRVPAGSDKTDFDPVKLEPPAPQQHIIDALGTIGCRFVRNELRGFTQAITFYAPIPEGQQPGPQIPQLTFSFEGVSGGLAVTAELTGRPQTVDRHQLSAADVDRLSATEGGWIGEVDRWVSNVLDKLGQQQTVNPGNFMKPHAPVQSGYAGGQRPYAYSGHGQQHGYKYSGYHGRPSMAGSIAAGVGGAALGFIGGMIIGDMISDAMMPDIPTDAAGVAEAAGIDPGVADAAGATDVADTGFDSGGYDDFGGGGGFDDFGGGDFGGF
jgi:sporulation-control protein